MRDDPDVRAVGTESLSWYARLGPTSLFHLQGGGIPCPPSAHPQPTPGLGSLFPSTWPLTLSMERVWTFPIEQIVQIKTKQETNEQFQEEREGESDGAYWSGLMREGQGRRESKERNKYV